MVIFIGSLYSVCVVVCIAKYLNWTNVLYICVLSYVLLCFVYMCAVVCVAMFCIYVCCRMCCYVLYKCIIQCY